MTNTITSDRAMRTAQFALNGLVKQEEIIGQNLANVDTPGYHARTADFQSALQSALNKNESLALNTTQVGHISLGDDNAAMSLSLRQGGSERADGNNVDIDVEMTQMTETQVNYQALTQLASMKLSLLKPLASGGGS